MATPLTPHWTQPSHPDIQKVLYSSSSPAIGTSAGDSPSPNSPANSSSNSNSPTTTSTPPTGEFTTTSISTIDLPPFALYAPLTFPPCTISEVGATYATVQMGREKHLELNSDLLFVEHSCEPSLIFNTTTMTVTAGPRGLKAGELLSFFYPSTEWDMAQGFECRCNTASCRGWIAGAKNMSRASLERDGMWLSEHVKELLDERDASSQENPKNGAQKDDIKEVEIKKQSTDTTSNNGTRGISSRELSGEMGGDTTTN